MINVGKINKLEVQRETNSGFYLGNEQDDTQVFLPPALATEALSVGDRVSVFVYYDKSRSLIANMKMPMACIDEFAYLRVKQVENYGTFFNWGIEKDLLVPREHQKDSMQMGEYHLVRVCHDAEKKEIFGSCKSGQFIATLRVDLSIGQEVLAFPYKRGPHGFNCIVNNAYLGIFYDNELQSSMRLRQLQKGYVKRIRDDNLIDLSQSPIGIDALKVASETILEKLTANGGYLNLHDQSDPAEIRDCLGMSKKVFKKSLGILLKNKRIQFEDLKIILLKNRRT